jgi:hypothetical protein
LVPDKDQEVDWFGTNELFAAMTAPSQFKPLASAMGNFRALLQCHDIDQLRKWSGSCLAGLAYVHTKLKGDESGLAVSHSPTIELALWKSMGFPSDLPDDVAVMKEMDGLVLEFVEKACPDPGWIKVVKKIPAPVLEPAKA